MTGKQKSDQAAEEFGLSLQPSVGMKPTKRKSSDKESYEGPVQQEFFSDVMPSISSSVLEIPNIFVLSNLFPVPLRRRMASDEPTFHHNVQLDSIKGVGSMKYTGPELLRDHEDVLLCLIHKMQRNQQSIMSPVRVSVYEILEDLKRSTGAKNYESIIKVLRDLDRVSLEISDERILSNLVSLWENRESTSPRMQRFLEGHTELIQVLSEDMEAGKRFLTVKFIRNIVGEMGRGERFGIELDPYTVLMYGNQSTIRVPSLARKQYQEKLTYKLVPMVRWQSKRLLDWSEATWQKLILPREEQMSFDRKDRNRRTAFRRNFEAALAEAEKWGEILPGWDMEERYIRKDGTRGKGQKTFITRNIRRLHPEIRVLLVQHKFYNGHPEHIFFSFLQSSLYRTRSVRSTDLIKVSLDRLVDLYKSAPVIHEEQPVDDDTETWEKYLQMRMATYKSIGLLPASTEIVYETVDTKTQMVLTVSVNDHPVFKSLRDEMSAELPDR